MTAQRSACVIFEVEMHLDDITAIEWREGPLPIPIGEGGTADRHRRLRYFEPRVSESLYGSPGHPARWHRNVTAGEPITAVELLRMPQTVSAPDKRSGIAVMHMDLGNAPLETVRNAANLAANRTRYSQLLPDGVEASLTSDRAFTVSHVTFSDGVPKPVMPSQYSLWTTCDQWLWLLASATAVTAFPPDPDDEDLFAGRVRFSADWQGLVLRDGVAFVGTSPDPGDDTTFHPAANVLVRTLYLDVFILGLLQVTGVNNLANSLYDLLPREANAQRLLKLERRLIELRRALWSNHITRRSKANELLMRFQEQHRLPDLIEWTGTVLTDTARYVETSHARRTSGTLGILSAVGLPLGLAYAAGALWTVPGPMTLLICTMVAMATAGLLFAVLPPLRRSAAEDLLKSED